MAKSNGKDQTLAGKTATARETEARIAPRYEAARTATATAKATYERLAVDFAGEVPGVSAEAVAKAQREYEQRVSEARIFEMAVSKARSDVAACEAAEAEAATVAARQAKLERCAALGGEGVAALATLMARGREMLADFQNYVRVCEALDREGLPFERRSDLSRHMAPGAVVDRLGAVIDTLFAHAGRPTPPNVQYERDRDLDALIDDEHEWLQLFSDPDFRPEDAPQPEPQQDTVAAAPASPPRAVGRGAALLEEPVVAVYELEDAAPGERRRRANSRARGLNG